MPITSLLLLSVAAAAPQEGLQGTCNAKPIQYLVGKPATTRNKMRAKQRSGAQIVREVPEGGIMTMDYSPNRLNIIIGKKGQITRLDCG